MPRLGLLLVIGTVANLITALAALFVAVQFWRLDVSGGSLTVDISGPVPVHAPQGDEGRPVPLEVTVTNLGILGR
jgi:hypothetical protein